MKKLTGIAALVIILGFSFYAYTALTTTATVTVTGLGDFASVTGNSISWSVCYWQIKTPPTETLYTITPDSDYTGDLLITVYLTNAGELIGPYKFLILQMRVYDESGSQVGNTEYITLTKPSAVWLISYPAGGWGGDYTVKITGGSYLILYPAGSGDSLSPSFYCEVAQK